jgi:transposase-like protein
MPTISPTFCPYPDCDKAHFRYQRRGSFRRACDGRLVPRYHCLQCRRSFSSQTFRVDFRHHRPQLNQPILLGFVSKVTMRQLARTLGCNLKTVAHRLELFGKQAKAGQAERLRAHPHALSEHPFFVFDELETFEQNRRGKPLTVPVLVQAGSRFIVDIQVGMLPPRRKDRGYAPRPHESKRKVRRCLVRLKRLLLPQTPIHFVSDKKPTYPRILGRVFGKHFVHEQVDSKAVRNRKNPLFLVNHTLAMLRDGLSRLVRRTWAHAKRRERLEDQLWIYLAWRNFVRAITNKRQLESAASVAGLATRRLSLSELITLRGRFGGS